MASDVTPTLRAKILRLFGVPECGRCCGTSFIEAPDGGDPLVCTRCDGLGVTLLDATRENWPFTRIIGCLCWPQPCECYREDPYFPNFPKDPAAAVVLAEQMSRIGQVHCIVRLDPDGDPVYCVKWEVDDDMAGGWKTMGGFWDDHDSLAAGLLYLLEATS